MLLKGFHVILNFKIRPGLTLSLQRRATGRKRRLLVIKNDSSFRLIRVLRMSGSMTIEHEWLMGLL